MTGLLREIYADWEFAGLGEPSHLYAAWKIGRIIPPASSAPGMTEAAWAAYGAALSKFRQASPSKQAAMLEKMMAADDRCRANGVDAEGGAP